MSERIEATYEEWLDQQNNYARPMEFIIRNLGGDAYPNPGNRREMARRLADLMRAAGEPPKWEYLLERVRHRV